MKIGLITIYSVPNYGSVLQAYATQKILELKGHECVIIRYDYYRDQMRNSHNYKSILKTIVLDYLPHLKTFKLREFRDKFFHFSKPYKSLKDLNRNDWSGYDAFIVGSDQVWNTKYLKGNPAFLLSFVPEGKPRFSLSSSFALKQLPDEYVDIYKHELSKFNGLSVREENGVYIINQQLQINSKVKVTLDPTLLLNREQWAELTPKKTKIKTPYILVYLWSYAFEPRPYFERVVEQFQQETGYEVRVLEGHRHLNDLKVPFIDNNRSSIKEFIQLFANSSLVVTSSFHGTAFAVNFGKPLISIVPDGNSDDRQLSLLKALDLNNCIVRVGDDINSLNPYYDSDIEQNALSKLRDESLNWIYCNLTHL